jgi:hypothetical protein
MPVSSASCSECVGGGAAGFLGVVGLVAFTTTLYLFGKRTTTIVQLKPDSDELSLGDQSGMRHRLCGAGTLLEFLLMNAIGGQIDADWPAVWQVLLTMGGVFTDLPSAALPLSCLREGTGMEWRTSVILTTLTTVPMVVLIVAAVRLALFTCCNQRPSPRGAHGVVAAFLAHLHLLWPSLVYRGLSVFQCFSFEDGRVSEVWEIPGLQCESEAHLELQNAASPILVASPLVVWLLVLLRMWRGAKYETAPWLGQQQHPPPQSNGQQWLFPAVQDALLTPLQRLGVVAPVALLGRRRPMLALLLAAAAKLFELGARIRFQRFETVRLNQLAVRCAAGNLAVYLAGLCFALARAADGTPAADGTEWLPILASTLGGAYQLYVLWFSLRTICPRKSLEPDGGGPAAAGRPPPKGAGTKYMSEGAFGFDAAQKRAAELRIAFRLDATETVVSQLEAATEALAAASVKMPERAPEFDAVAQALSRELHFATAAKEAVEVVAPEKPKTWEASAATMKKGSAAAAGARKNPWAKTAGAAPAADEGDGGAKGPAEQVDAEEQEGIEGPLFTRAVRKLCGGSGMVAPVGANTTEDDVDRPAVGAKSIIGMKHALPGAGRAKQKAKDNNGTGRKGDGASLPSTPEDDSHSTTSSRPGTTQKGGVSPIQERPLAGPSLFGNENARSGTRASIFGGGAGGAGGTPGTPSSARPKPKAQTPLEKAMAKRRARGAGFAPPGARAGTDDEHSLEVLNA